MLNQRSDLGFEPALRKFLFWVQAAPADLKQTGPKASAAKQHGQQRTEPETKRSRILQKKIK